MTKGTKQEVPVTVEWARLGKEKHDPGYRVLEHSDGVFNEDNFNDLLTRYSPGTLEPADLPQITISWSKDQRFGQRYVGIAKHYQQENGEGDASGRWVMLTNYFCVPFNDLVAGSVSYMAMHDRLAGLLLPLRPGGSIKTDLPKSSLSDFVIDAETRLAMRAAAALLTSDPVCVLGADHIGYLERLRFIDKIATFLPYGMRSELSASTWASPTFRQHKLRLFFADADREQGDRLIVWGQPGNGRIGQAYADEYLQLLQAGVLTPNLLAAQKSPTGFDQRHIVEVLGKLSAVNGQSRKKQALDSHAFEPTPEDAGAPAIDGWPAPPDPSPDAQQTELEPFGVAAGEHGQISTIGGASIGGEGNWEQAQRSGHDRVDEIGDVKEILASCAFALRQNDEVLLARCIERLNGRVRVHPPQVRNQLKAILSDHGVLSRTPFSNSQLLQEFYGLLLQLAFPSPIKYQAYRHVETVGGYSAGERLPAPLARAMLRVPMEGAVRLLVLNSLDRIEFELALSDKPIEPYQSVPMLVDQQLDSPYVEIVDKMALRNLSATTKTSDHDRELFQQSMVKHNLVKVLQQRYAEQPDQLYNTLDVMLRYAYDGHLSLRSARKLLDDIHTAPSEALLWVMLAMAKPTDRDAITREYFLRRINYGGFSPDRTNSLQELILQKSVANPKAARARGGQLTVANKIIFGVLAFLVLVLVVVIVLVVVSFAQSLP